MLSTDFTDFLLRIGGVRALVLASGKSGKSVDNKKRVLLLAEQILQFVLSTDFTDFCYAGLGLWACCHFRASIFVGRVGLVGRVGRERTYRSQASVRRTDSR